MLSTSGSAKFCFVFVNNMSCSLEDEKWCCLCHDTSSLGHDDLIEKPFLLLLYLYDLAQLFGGSSKNLPSRQVSLFRIGRQFYLINLSSVESISFGISPGNAVLKFRIDLDNNGVRVNLVTPQMR